MGCRVLGIRLQHTMQDGDGLLPSSLQAEHAGPFSQVYQLLRCLLGRLAVAGQGPVPITLRAPLLIQLAEEEVGLSQGGFQVHSLLQGAYGCRRFPLLRQQRAQQVVGLRILRIQPHNPLQMDEGSLRLR